MSTEALYYADPYLRSFQGRVLSCRQDGDGYLVTLDRTAFYPEGGGQPCDTGTLGDARVLDVQERDGTILHRLDRAAEVGALLPGEIDWERRFDHMQQHSGEHIVSGMLCARFACDNVGFHLGADVVTIDYNTVIPREALREVEAAANRYLWEDHPVEIAQYRGEALSAIDYRSKKAIPGAVRIVSFPGADCCACCGTHVRRAAEVGIVKFLSVQNLRGGVRIELLCGQRAYRYLARCWEEARAIGQGLSVKPEKAADAVARLREEAGAAKARADHWQALAFRGIAREMRGAGDVLLFQEGLSGEALRRLADTVAGECGGLAAVFTGEGQHWSYALCRRDGDVAPETRAVNAALRGRGGGRGGLSQGSVAAERAEIEILFSDFKKG